MMFELMMKIFKCTTAKKKKSNFHSYELHSQTYAVSCYDYKQ